jgi:hypothetical protein
MAYSYILTGKDAPEMANKSTTHNVLHMPRRLEPGRIWLRASFDFVSY